VSTATTELEVCLRERFGLDQFRPGQREVIETVLARRDCLCVMPTGGGKSLCYQLPSLLSGGVTLVVSPLIALMKDQVDGLIERGMRATLINSTIDTATQNERIAAMERGEFDLVYVAPERFRSGRFNEAISRTHVALLAVDEAHCISEWGHDFRPDYTRLGRARKRLGNPPTIALTATATDNVRRDICEQLELTDPKIFITGFDRPNLRYEVRYASSDAAKQGVLTEVFKQTPGAGIVYCSSRKRCEEVAEFLRGGLKRKSLVYHAGMQLDERRKAQDAFMNGRDLVVVATNAFGMGVDKSDIRFVVHYNMPGTVEAYYQEAGRAGRDGNESLCMLLYAPGDRYIQEFFIESEYPNRTVVAAIYDFLAHQPEDPIEMTQEQIKERLGLEISDMGVGASLKLLESAGALERLRPRENMGIIRIDSEVSLVGLLPQNATVQRKVLSALERLVALNSSDDTYFSPHALAQRLDLDPVQFSRALHELRDKLPIEYVPPFRGNAVRMIDRKRTIATLGIDFDELDKRRQREYDKLDQVINYAVGRECRRRTILTYFGDHSPVQCGHCDNCHAKPLPPASKVETTDRVTEIVRKILSGIARATARCRFGLGKRIVAGMLAGKAHKQIKKWGLDKLSTFGLLEEFSQEELVLLIENLIPAGWVQQEEPERFKPVISLTDTGREVMRGERPATCQWRVPADLAAKLRQDHEPAAPGKRTQEQKVDRSAESFEPPSDEPFRSADPELLKKLKAARNRWAAEEQLPSYMVLANSVLDELARVQPQNIERMLAVKGIGPAKVAKYGERLLEILGSSRKAAADAGHTLMPSGAAGTESGRREPAAVPDSPIPQERDHPKQSPSPTAHRSPPPRRDSESLTTYHSPLTTHGPPSHYWTWRLLERGFTQAECAIIRDIDESAVLAHAIMAAREAHRVPLDAFLTEQQIEAIEQFVGRTPTDQIDRHVDDLPDGVGREHVQLYVLNRSRAN
jgi:ATP-dependent DNA helicase RecQ